MPLSDREAQFFASLPNRARAALYRHGLKTVADIARLSGGALWGLAGVGPKIRKDIKQALVRHGFNEGSGYAHSIERVIDALADVAYASGNGRVREALREAVRPIIEAHECAAERGILDAYTEEAFRSVPPFITEAAMSEKREAYMARKRTANAAQ